MELLAPAGNIEKLFYVYEYGADAAYIGIKNFSLRARADNFNTDEYLKVRELKGNRKLYGALNIFFKNSDISRLEENIEYLKEYPFDAFIISDIGILPILRKHYPDIPLHLSTQASCINASAASIYKDMGFSRVILGRETSLDEVKQIKDSVKDLELEIFIHGAMCLAYSGRCFLSKYMIDRSANQGDCAHSCRWQYRVLEEEQRSGQYYPVVSGENFTTILSSKDLCMFDYMKAVKDAGVDSCKIEGRMKSIYYAAVITRAYRKAIDSVNGKTVPDLKRYREDLFNVSHREYTTGFYFGFDDVQESTQKNYLRRYKFLGSIGAEERKGLFRLNVKNQIMQGQELEYIGPDIPAIQDNSYVIYDSEMNPVTQADHGKEYFIKPGVPVQQWYILRMKTETEESLVG